MPFEAHLVALARAKAHAVACRFPEGFVLGADTALCIDRAMLGKAGSAAAAAAMLRTLAGRTHRLSTAVCVIGPTGRGKRRRTLCGVDTVRVTLRAWSPRQIAAYVAAVRPFHCAGAYALQEGGTALIERIQGDPATVVGLPIGLVARLLRQAGYPVP